MGIRKFSFVSRIIIRFVVNDNHPPPTPQIEEKHQILPKTKKQSLKEQLRDPGSFYIVSLFSVRGRPS